MKITPGQSISFVALLGIGVAVGAGWSLFRRQAARGAEADARATAASPAKVQRYGSVIGLKPEMKDEYVRLHAKVWPEVLAMLAKCNIRNYSIYLSQLDGKLYLFSYFEYVGSDFDKDMALMKADPKTQEWWKYTDPCQIRLPGTKQGDQWQGIPEVFHME